MLRTATTLLVSCFLILGIVLSASAATAESNQILLVLDKVNVDKSGSTVVGKANASVTHEYVGDLGELLERVDQIKCEDLTGVVTLEVKKVDNTIQELLADRLRGCPTPVIEVNIEDMAKLEAWQQSGFNPFKESSGTSTPALRIQGDIALAEGGRGQFVIAAGDSGSWVESWKLDEGQTLFGKAASPLAPSADSAVTKGCGGGPWWPLCCSTQYSICNAIHGIPFIGPLLCSNCYASCYFSCRYGCINNPCHSCDPCGLTWLLCRFIPGASC